MVHNLEGDGMVHDGQTKKTEDWVIHLSRILAERESVKKSGQRSPAWIRKRANLRRGVAAGTEHYAYAEVLPYVNAGRARQTVLLRLFSLVADFDDIAMYEKGDGGKSRSLGQWAYLVSSTTGSTENERFELDPSKPDKIAQRLAFIHALDVEEAILAIRRIMMIATSGDQTAPAIDYYQLFRTFLFWGDGFTPASIQTRSRILRDYYVGVSVPSEASPTTSK